jgi:dTDP-4-dehydrorhamnose reductase
MRVVVVGARGMLGHVLCDVLAEHGHDVLPLGRDELDVLPRADALVNCAAWSEAATTSQAAPTSPRSATSLPPEERAFQTNSVLPHRLALRFGGPMLHISTDGVFTGGGPSDETHAPDALTQYGLSKRVGEPPEAMVLRVSHVGPEQAYKRHLLSRLASARDFVGYTDHQWNGMTTLALAHALVDILAGGHFIRGVFHLFSDDITKGELCDRLARAFGLPVSLVLAPSGVPCDRRLRTVHPLRDRLAIPPLDAQVEALVRWVRAPGRCARYPELVGVAMHDEAWTRRR